MKNYWPVLKKAAVVLLGMDLLSRTFKSGSGEHIIWFYIEVAALAVLVPIAFATPRSSAAPRSRKFWMIIMALCVLIGLPLTIFLPFMPIFGGLEPDHLLGTLIEAAICVLCWIGFLTGLARVKAGASA